MTETASLFADTYPAARAKFLLAAAEAGGRLTTYVHPSQTGPDGGTLSVDVACFGADTAPKAALILSGTHGPEGYLGSAAQIALLRDGAAARLPADQRLVLVHGINPYGFAHWSRTTENNVDLNRNFIDFSGRLPTNPVYLDLHGTMCPAEWTEATRQAGKAANDAYIQQHGLARWMDGMMRGQFEEPTGLNYGGRFAEWSNCTLELIVRRHLAGVRQVGFIDWHTGLGAYGEPFFLCFNEQGGPLWERACAWWGRERVETKEGFNGAPRPQYSGLVFQGLQRFLAPAEMAGAVIEFGTGPVETMMDWLRLDRWIRFGGPAPDGVRDERRRGVRDAFCPPDPAWRKGVVGHAVAIQNQLLAGVAAW